VGAEVVGAGGGCGEAGPSKPKLVGSYNPAQRKERIQRFHAKRVERIYKKKIKYTCRKKLADSRPRVKGRFVKRVVEDLPAPAP
jgi:hypothetical protein